MVASRNIAIVFPLLALAFLEIEGSPQQSMLIGSDSCKAKGLLCGRSKLSGQGCCPGLTCRYVDDEISICVKRPNDGLTVDPGDSSKVKKTLNMMRSLPKAESKLPTTDDDGETETDTIVNVPSTVEPCTRQGGLCEQGENLSCCGGLKCVRTPALRYRCDRDYKGKAKLYRSINTSKRPSLLRSMPKVETKDLKYSGKTKDKVPSRCGGHGQKCPCCAGFTCKGSTCARVVP